MPIKFALFLFKYYTSHLRWGWLDILFDQISLTCLMSLINCLLFLGLLLGSLFQPDKKKEVPVHVHYYRRYGGYAGQYGGYAGY